MEEKRYDIRLATNEEKKQNTHNELLLYKLRQTMPHSETYMALLHELVGTLGEGSYIAAPLSGAALNHLHIGKDVFINANFLAMARGEIIIEDHVQIAGNVSVLSNNHDLYDRAILTLKPVHIKKGAWIGANATILPGISIGKYAVIGAGAVVTKDIPDYSVAVGNPAKVIKQLDQEKIKES